MSIATLLETLRQQGIDLWVEEHRLRYRAPKGAMTPALRQQLGNHKDELIATLTRQSYLSLSASSILPPIQPVDRHIPLPLSFTQQRLWFLEQLQPGTPAYTIVTTLRMHGRIYLPTLEESFNTVIARHDILRTSIQVSDGQPVQVIAATLHLSPTIIDLQHLPPDQCEAETSHRIAAEAQYPFDLANPPMLRVTFLHHTPDQHMLIVTTHHMVADGWSLNILLHEVQTLYHTLVEQPAPIKADASPLPALPLQFADYAVWQCQLLECGALEQQMAFWQRQLATAPKLLALPTDHPRPPIQRFRGAVQAVVLPRSLTEPLKAVSRRERVTLFMLLLAAFQTLLFRYTHQDDIVVATAVSHRPHRDLEGVIGPFSNNLLLRTSFADNPDVRTLLGRVRQVVIDAFAHQDLPFERLVEALQPQRSLSHNPLFQVMFLLQNAPAPLPQPENGEQSPGRHNLIVVPVPPTLSTGVTKFDLSLMLYETSAGLEGIFEYSTDLFEADTIARMADHFAMLLEGIAANPQQSTAVLPLLTSTEQQQIVVDWNVTEKPYPAGACIHHLFEAQVERTPHAIALTYGDQRLTYQALNSYANLVAAHLRRYGVAPGVLVGICIERSFECIAGILGILKAGGAYVPLDPHAPPARLTFLIDDAQIPILLTRTELVGQFALHATQVVCIDDLQEEPEQGMHPVQSGQPRTVTYDDLAYVIYTSGSTGTPRGVMVHHQAVCNLACAHIEAFEVQPASRVLQFAALSFDAAVSEIFAALLAGAVLDLGMPDYPRAGRDLLNLIRDRAITIVTMPPSVLASLPTEPLPDLKTLVVAGEVCSAELVQQWATGRRFMNGYGPTEATVCTTLALCHSDGKPPPIGRPIANMQVYLLDHYQQPVPVGVVGEICIGGVGVAKGYLNRPDLTADRFLPHPFSTQPGARLYRSGDLARYRRDGVIEFLGRVDHQVKLRGFRIEPGEIEATLRQQPGVREAVVVLREDVPGDPRLVAYIVPTGVGEQLQHSWRHPLQETLPDYMVPSAFVVLDALPLTSHGKVDRQALPAPAPAQTTHSEHTTAPRDRLEYDLVRIWERVLATRPVGVDDNFFDLGGHSLLAVRLLEQVRSYSGRDIPLTQLFLGGTIADMARLLRSTDGALPWSPLVPMQPHGTKTPFFCVHPLLGVVFPYYDLAHHLGPEQPFYGLQAAGLHPEQQPHISVTEMAAHYIAALQTIQPHGPYHLGGWSFGSFVAFEMAQQLHQQGETVALLALFDTPPPGSHLSSVGLLIFLLTSLRFVWPYISDYLALSVGSTNSRASSLLHLLVQCIVPGARRTYLLRSADDKQDDKQQAGQHASIQRMVRLLAMNVQVAETYQPAVYPGGVTLFLTPASHRRYDPARRWEQLVAGGVEKYIVPGNHYNLLRPPHVQLLAEHLRILLNARQRE